MAGLSLQMIRDPLAAQGGAGGAARKPGEAGAEGFAAMLSHRAEPAAPGAAQTAQTAPAAPEAPGDAFAQISEMQAALHVAAAAADPQVSSGALTDLADALGAIREEAVQQIALSGGSPASLAEIEAGMTAGMQALLTQFDAAHGTGLLAQASALAAPGALPDAAGLQITTAGLAPEGQGAAGAAASTAPGLGTGAGGRAEAGRADPAVPLTAAGNGTGVPAAAKASPAAPAADLTAPKPLTEPGGQGGSPDAAGTVPEASARPRGFAALIAEAAARAEARPDPALPAETLAREVEAAPAGRAIEAAPRPQPMPPAPPQQPSGFSRALTRQIRDSEITAEGHTRIALTPAGLGEIEIELSREAGQLRVVIRAENQNVLQALRGDREGLMAALGDGGSNVDDSGLSFESFERSRDEAPEGGAAAPGTASEEDADETDETAAAPRGDGGLDILT